MSEVTGMEMTRIHHHPCKGQRRKNMNMAGRGNKGINVPRCELDEHGECAGECVSVVSVCIS